MGIHRPYSYVSRCQADSALATTAAAAAATAAVAPSAQELSSGRDHVRREYDSYRLRLLVAWGVSLDQVYVATDHVYHFIIQAKRCNLVHSVYLFTSN